MISRALGDEWGFDTNTKLNATMAQALASATCEGQPLRFCWRYVFFSQAHQGDLSPLETKAILDTGLTLLVVQHVRNPGWTASGQLGRMDGQWAVRNALEAGYAPAEGQEAPCLALDLEGLANSGAAVADHADEWCLAVASAGFAPVVYVGYDAGLNPSELYELPHVQRYWSDMGPRTVAARGFCCKQGPQVTIVGVQVDVDHAYPDAFGGALVGLSSVPAERPTMPEFVLPDDAQDTPKPDDV